MLAVFTEINDVISYPYVFRRRSQSNSWISQYCVEEESRVSTV